MLSLIQKFRNYIDTQLRPNILQVTEESRLFILLRFINLLDKLNFRFVNPTEIKMRFFRKYYVLVKLPQIESLADPAIILSPDLLKHYNLRKNIYFIYDISTEAITFTDYTSNILVSFHQILKNHKINNKRIILLCSNANAEEHYNQWVEKKGLTEYRIKLLGYHFYLYEYLWETERCEWLQKNHSTLINSALDTVKNGKKREKYFLCLNLRPRKHRTAVVLHLLERGYLNKGHVTYFGDDFAEHDSVDKANDRLQFIENLPSKDRLIPFIENLKKMTPLVLDKDADKMRKDLWQRNMGSVEFLIPEGDDIAVNGINSYFEIVTETWLTDQSTSYITEKTIRPILRLQPFIHVGSPDLLKFLKSIGFQTFSPYINESYDEISDPYLRLEAIFQEIDRLCNMRPDEIHQLYCDLWPRLLHNSLHFKHAMIDTAQESIEASVLKRINPRLVFSKAD